MIIKVGEDGLFYVVFGVLFEFLYSYIEILKVKFLVLWEFFVVLFGSGIMFRFWIGWKLLLFSKKKFFEFDLFNFFFYNKKGVKFV